MTSTPRTPSRRLPRVWLYAVMIALASFFVLPVYLLLITSFKDFSEVSLSQMWDWPQRLSLDSFNRAWFGEGTGTEALQGAFGNSVFMVIPATILSCLVGSMNGYVLSKWKFKGSETLFTLMLFGMFIPYQSILVPLVQTLAAIPAPTNTGSLYGNLYGLILTHVIYGIPITTLIFRNYYAGVPKELVEAGQIDGAGFFGVYKDVILPLSIPGFVVVAIWQFTSIWNEFLFGLILTNEPRLRPVTVALQNMSGSQFTQWNVQMAGAIIVALPTLLVYIFLGKYFLRGLLAGSLKG